MADCEQPTRAPTKLRFRQFQRFIFSRLTVGPEIRHGNPPFLRLTAEFERSEKPATSSLDQRRLSHGGSACPLFPSNLPCWRSDQHGQVMGVNRKGPPCCHGRPHFLDGHRLPSLYREHSYTFPRPAGEPHLVASRDAR